MGQPNIQIGDWRFYTDATPDTSMVALAAENTKPTLTQAQIENGIIRLRCQLLNIGDKDDLADVEVQYSVDNTNWNTISNQAGGSADQWIWWADGAATHGNTVTNLLLGDSDTYGLYHENTGLDEDVDQNTKVEFDAALYIQWPPPSTTVRLRILYDGVAEEMEDGVPQIQFDTPSPSNRSHTIDKLDPPSSGSQAEIRGAMRPNTWFDGSYWWTFVADADNSDTLLYYYWSGSGNWSSAQSRTFTDTTPARGNDVRCKTISGYKVVMVYWNHNQSGNRYVRRGTISGTTITWGNEISSGVDWRGERVAVGIDDGNYWWCGGIQSATGVWAVRATNADAGSSWTTGFNSERTASDTGVATDDQCAIIGLASNKMLMIWRSGDALKWALCTDPSGFGSVNTLVSTANPVDWGVARAGGYVYLVHTDSTGVGGNWVLRVFNESTESWSLGTSPSVSGQPSSGDGILVQADGDDIYAWGTFTGTGGGTHRSVEGKKYSGPGASGTWDGSRTVITPAIARGNGDHINGAPEIANGKALVIFEFGDANLDGQKWSMEFHYLEVGGAVVSFSATSTAQSVTPDTVDLEVKRAFSATSAAASATPDTADLEVKRAFSAISAGASLTPDDVTLSIIVPFSATIAAVSASPDNVSLEIIRSFTATIASSSASPDNVSLEVIRTFSAILAAGSATPDDAILGLRFQFGPTTITAASATPDNVALSILVLFTGTIIATSATPDTAVLGLQFQLPAATATADSVTPDTAPLEITRALSAIAAASSVTPETAVLGLKFQLGTATLTAASATPDEVTLNIVVLFAATIAAGSATPDNVSLQVTRAFLATSLAQSATPDTATLVVTRALSAVVAASSATPDTAILGLKFQLGTATIAAASATPDDAVLNIVVLFNAIIAAGSATPDTASLEVERLLSAVLAAGSQTPDVAVLGLRFQVSAILTAQSATPDATLEINRALVAVVASASAAPEDVALPITRGLQTVVSAGSATPDTASLEVLRALTAALTAVSVTPDDAQLFVTGAAAFSAVIQIAWVTPDDAHFLIAEAKLLDVALSDSALFRLVLADVAVYSVSVSDVTRTTGER